MSLKSDIIDARKLARDLSKAAELSAKKAKAARGGPSGRLKAIKRRAANWKAKHQAALGIVKELESRL